MKAKTTKCTYCGANANNKLNHPETGEKVCIRCQTRAFELINERYALEQTATYKEQVLMEEPQFRNTDSYFYQFFIGTDESWRERMDRLDSEVAIIEEFTTFARNNKSNGIQR